MAPTKVSGKFHTQVYEEASHWLIRHRTAPLSPQDKRSFDAWLRTSPECIQAYLEISAIWEEIALLDPHSSAPAAELFARASADEPVASLRNACEPRAATDKGRQPRIVLRIAASIAALGMICAGLLVWWTRAPTYSTGIGEQRSITLADGSVVHLNARTEIRVQFLAHQRDVALLQGQALFDVAKDPARPFLVRAGSTRIQVVGTRFDVNESRAGTFITVVTGRVAVFGPQVARMSGLLALPAIPSYGEDSADLLKGLPLHVQPIFLSAEEQLTVTADRVEEAHHVDVANVTAWTERRFVFDDAPLAEVVDEFNRYNARPLVLTDPEVADMRINAVFSSPNSSLLVRFLRAQPEIAVVETSAEIRISAQ
ncbi:MAG: FecR family protein [Steroidobacteraceae bacterium]